MQSRLLGNSQIRISPVIFGAWAIGGWMWGGNTEKDSLEAIQVSINHGITTIDTAPIYGMGLSEELVGKAIQGKRDKVVIATKCGLRWDSKQGSDSWSSIDNQGNAIIIRKNSHADSILYECEQSLKRLKTDYIDLYQIHWPDSSFPCEESWKTIVKLKEQGKVKAIGVSNYSVEWMQRIQSIHPINSNQPPYSLIRRDIEKDMVPFCQHNNISLIVYSPLERGLLTGNVSLEREFAATDHRSTSSLFSKENRILINQALDSIRPIAESHQATLSQLIINWTVHQPGITAALVGARNAQQAQENALSLSFTLSSDELSHIRSAFTPLLENIQK